MLAGAFVIAAGIALWGRSVGFGVSLGPWLVLPGIALVLMALATWRLTLLRLANERLATISDAVPAIVFLQNEHGVCTYVNHRWSEFTGKPRAAALGFGLHALVHPDDARRLGGVVATARARVISFEVELRYRAASDTWKWLLVEVTPLRDGHGNVYGWVGAARDYQEHVEAAQRIDAALTAARQTAASLQQALQPPALPTLPGIGFAATYRVETSEGEIGGDFYDVFLLPDGQIATMIGDVVGHGLDAAATMIRTREMLRAAAMLEGPHPGQILAAANRTMAASATDGTFATAALAVFDPRTLRLQSSVAGHPCPRLLRGEGIVELSRGGLPLGVMPDARYDVEVTYLEPGDRIVFFTDGLIEATRDLLQGERRLTAALSSGLVDPDALVDYVAGAQRHDDVAVLTMRIADHYPIVPETEPAWRFFSTDSSTAVVARASLTAYLRKRNIPPATIESVEVVFGELVGNVVRHAPGPIEVELFWSSSIPALVVRDRGSGFSPATVMPDVLSENGRGLFLVEEQGGRLFVMPRHGGGSDVMVLLPMLASAATGQSVAEDVPPSLPVTKEDPARR